MNPQIRQERSPKLQETDFPLSVERQVVTLHYDGGLGDAASKGLQGKDPKPEPVHQGPGSLMKNPRLGKSQGGQEREDQASTFHRGLSRCGPISKEVPFLNPGYLGTMKIAILGPTASGKSGLAVAVARRVGGTVINGDPFQSIAGLGIGTGQPSEAEQDGVPHVGYGLLPLSTRPNPAQFGELVRTWLAPIDIPVLVTGSGLYLQGIWEQLTELPDVPQATVAKVRHWSEVLGVRRLHRLLVGLDPKRAVDLHPNDGARVMRALALHLATGQKVSDLLTGVRLGVPEGWRTLVVLSTREMRRKRVELRVAEQLKAGWQDEVAHLLEMGHRADLEALRPLGYRGLAEMADGSRHSGIERIIQETQAFAKRQATWFRNRLPDTPHWDPEVESMDGAFEKLGLS